MNSEVARLREQIKLECEAMKQGVSGLAMVARHDVIQQKYLRLEHPWKQLERLVGAEAATQIVCRTYFEVGGEAEDSEEGRMCRKANKIGPISEKQYVVVLSSTELATALLVAQQRMAELSAKHPEQLSSNEQMLLYGLHCFITKVEQIIEQERRNKHKPETR
ncbi:hypothetical protein EI42_05669 [Thermosporothrix hazakensis]|jgi:hypothetical protein|uniref:Uncharacterized protein n=1 Tax=Thermosporothrix hazakensis TaxID=644383 RepID=A0A326TXK6_THEHA|nr:hypothetical protein [Thermosporothrix hazakensis]PZW21133.1 hypothetical protein EI42_05669 [Thermosporothrix hazakensis]GCE50699.1 hypothetical protein KTH_55680 [Thermosporothrix hazakensis]